MLAPALVGTWTGTNGFRLMPGDPLRELPATLSVTLAAGGHLGLVAYTWQHPDDGPQDGLILVASGGSDDDVVATWGDSWHQKPETMTLPGHRAADGSVTLEGEYGDGWGWRITLSAGLAGSSGEPLLRMDNVIPPAYATAEVAAGPYPVMVLTAQRD